MNVSLPVEVSVMSVLILCSVSIQVCPIQFFMFNALIIERLLYNPSMSSGILSFSLYLTVYCGHGELIYLKK